MGIYDNNLNVVVEYAYDSWGNVVSITGSMADTLGQDNPFRYRGYYFDSETGLYYLNSRYYDANIGRYINADGYASTGQGLLGSNMFSYCLNNPVNFYDPTGSFVVEFPADGVGDMIIFPEEGDPDLITYRDGDTFVVEVRPRKSVGSQVIEAINGEIIQEVATSFIDTFTNIQYKGYVQITFSNATGAVLTNIGCACNNVVYSAVAPYLNDLKIVGGSLVTVAAFGLDVYSDYCKYGGSQSDFYKAAIVDASFAFIGFAAGSILATAALSPVGLLIGTIAIGATMSCLETEMKRSLIGY